METPNMPNLNSKSARALSMGLELGFLIAFPLILFLLAGLWLDKKFGTLPLFIIIALILNMIFTVFNVKKIILPFLEKRSQKKIDNNNNN
jgi:F0F1-type ATP synthase assembly protein I